MDIDKQALQYVFPGELLDHFDIESAQIKLDEPTQEEYLEVVFTEKNVLPEGYSQKDYESKGFFTKVVQDFPLRGRAVFLKVKRRRWRHKQTGEQITRDFSFLAQGSKFTAELAVLYAERLGSKLNPFSTVGHYYRVNPDKLRRIYKKHSSGFTHWEQAAHAREHLLYPENITARLAIDEVSLSQGELYTIVSSRDKPGRKGKLIAIIASTKSEDIRKVLLKVPLAKREQVGEISMDMAPSMKKACREAFPRAGQVTDRFHVVRLVMDAMQHVRIDQRWKEIDKENDQIQKARLVKKRYQPIILVNGDTPKQLLARSRYLLYKRPDQ